MNLDAIKAQEWRTTRGLWEQYMTLENVERGYDHDAVQKARNKFYASKAAYEKAFSCKWHEDDQLDKITVKQTEPLPNSIQAIDQFKADNLPPVGHNNPPADDPAAEFQRQMADDYADVIAEAEKLAKGNPLDCEDDAYAERLTVYTSKLNATIKKLEDARKLENEPVLKKQRLINGYFNGIKDKLEAKKSAAKAKLDPYLKKKAAAQQEAAAAAAQALRDQAKALEVSQAALYNAGRPMEAGEAGRSADKLEKHAVKLDAVSTQAPTAAVHQVKVGTASASLRTVTVIRVTDRDALELEKLRPYLTLESLQKAAESYVKMTGQRDLKGVSVTDDQTTVVR